MISRSILSALFLRSGGSGNTHATVHPLFTLKEISKMIGVAVALGA